MSGLPSNEQERDVPGLKRELYFPTFIYFQDLPDAEKLNAHLIECIGRLRDQDAEGMHRSNVKQVGAWHSQDDLNRREEFDLLVTAILSATEKIYTDLGYDPEREPWVDNMWANVSPRHAFNRVHVHPGVPWSGVYYVQTPPKCGRIYFCEPRVQTQMLRPYISDEGKKMAENWSEVYFEPIAGRMILFPAWLQHEVEPNLSEEVGDAANRISISFNLVQRKRETQN